ncbi:tryptophan dimethylallyltransferase-domain-containing protein [Xylariaceae sp. FL0662B]|nr:tryptophan dimethylallyltransferase-domain-containing protein [Xylariaceae sp. FL0662B]
MAQIIHGETPQLHHRHLQFSLDGVSAASVKKESLTRDERIPRTPYCPVDLSIWQQVDSELGSFQSVHHRFWWSRHTGIALAVLLQNAGYPPDLQYRDLKFFAQVVAPNLGVSRERIGDGTQWPSFMTDDGTPLELSWDWGTKDNPPMIRYSVEPIGLHAGTSLDPGNLTAGPALQEQLVHSLPSMRLEWFNFFKEFFEYRNLEESRFVEDVEDHNSSIFYAFDLSTTVITAKVYFFPKLRAKACNQTNLEVLTQAIHEAPYCTEDNLKAWSVFHDFSLEMGKNLEHEMLAIDLIDPLESRLKLYFRCRETTFNSVINIMTLGGRIKNPKLYQGLRDLNRLWNALFDADIFPHQSLGEVSHRTAGILYNVEFKLGDSIPVAKIYLPVRHYSRSDEAVIRALNDCLRSHQRGKYMVDYVRAMSTLFSPQSLRARSGVQTYVGCAIRSDGTLRVVSYFKPQIPEFLSNAEVGK